SPARVGAADLLTLKRLRGRRDARPTFHFMAPSIPMGAAVRPPPLANSESVSVLQPHGQTVPAKVRLSHPLNRGGKLRAHSGHCPGPMEPAWTADAAKYVFSGASVLGRSNIRTGTCPKRIEAPLLRSLLRPGTGAPRCGW